MLKIFAFTSCRKQCHVTNANLKSREITSKRDLKIIVRLLSLVVIAVLQGCLDATTQQYGPITLPLDDLNELHISTYPADFPKTLESVPFLYKKIKTPDQVYFQVFVRAAGTTSGKNPNIDSITINSFSYYFPGQTAIQLISDYDQGFWMQANPNYDPAGAPPVPYNDHWHVRVSIDLTLNGVNYQLDERVDAESERWFQPLIIHAMH